MERAVKVTFKEFCTLYSIMKCLHILLGVLKGGIKSLCIVANVTVK